MIKDQTGLEDLLKSLPEPKQDLEANDLKIVM